MHHIAPFSVNPLSRARLVIAAFAILLVLSITTACGGTSDEGDEAADSSNGAIPTENASSPEASPTGDAAAGGDTKGFKGGTVKPAMQMPDMTLTDQGGQPINLQEQVQNGVTLFYVGYTNCPDICPTHLATASAAIDGLPEDVKGQVKLIMATADPERDTPEVLKEYMAQFDPDFIGVTGSVDEMIDLQRAFKLPVAETVEDEAAEGGYGLNHFAFVIAFGPDGEGHVVFPQGMSIESWQHDLTKLAREGFPHEA